MLGEILAKRDQAGRGEFGRVPVQPSIVSELYKLPFVPYGVQTVGSVPVERGLNSIIFFCSALNKRTKKTEMMSTDSSQEENLKILNPIEESRFKDSIEKREESIETGRAILQVALETTVKKDDESKNIFTQIFDLLAAPTQSVLDAAKAIVSNPLMRTVSQEEINRLNEDCLTVQTDANKLVSSAEVKQLKEKHKDCDNNWFFSNDWTKAINKKISELEKKEEEQSAEDNAEESIKILGEAITDENAKLVPGRITTAEAQVKQLDGIIKTTTDESEQEKVKELKQKLQEAIENQREAKKTYDTKKETSANNETFTENFEQRCEDEWNRYETMTHKDASEDFNTDKTLNSPKDPNSIKPETTEANTADCGVVTIDGKLIGVDIEKKLLVKETKEKFTTAKETKNQEDEFNLNCTSKVKELNDSAINSSGFDPEAEAVAERPVGNPLFPHATLDAQTYGECTGFSDALTKKKDAEDLKYTSLLNTINTYIYKGEYTKQTYDSVQSTVERWRNQLKTLDATYANTDANKNYETIKQAIEKKNVELNELFTKEIKQRINKLLKGVRIVVKAPVNNYYTYETHIDRVNTHQTTLSENYATWDKDGKADREMAEAIKTLKSRQQAAQCESDEKAINEETKMAAILALDRNTCKNHDLVETRLGELTVEALTKKLEKIKGEIKNGKKDAGTLDSHQKKLNTLKDSFYNNSEPYLPSIQKEVNGQYYGNTDQIEKNIATVLKDLKKLIDGAECADVLHENVLDKLPENGAGWTTTLEDISKNEKVRACNTTQGFFFTSPLHEEFEKKFKAVQAAGKVFNEIDAMMEEKEEGGFYKYRATDLGNKLDELMSTMSVAGYTELNELVTNKITALIEDRERQEQECEKASIMADTDERKQQIDKNKCPKDILDNTKELRQGQQDALRQLYTSAMEAYGNWEQEWETVKGVKDKTDKDDKNEKKTQEIKKKELEDFYINMEGLARQTREKDGKKYSTWKDWNEKQLTKQKEIIIEAAPPLKP